MIKKYSQKEVDFIKNNLHLGNLEIGKTIGRTADAVKDKIARMGLKRTPKQVTDLRRAYNSSHFKKGSLPHNYGNGETMHADGYVVVSLGESKQRLKHVHEWEKINGPLPKGHVLRCVDGNLKNTDPENWKLISRGENLLLNTINRYPKELRESMRLLSKLKRKHGQKQS